MTLADRFGALTVRSGTTAAPVGSRQGPAPVGSRQGSLRNRGVVGVRWGAAREPWAGCSPCMKLGPRRESYLRHLTESGAYHLVLTEVESGAAKSRLTAVSGQEAD